MIPLRDTIPAKNRPVVTRALIAANVAVFLWQMAQGPALEAFIYTWGLVPARYSVPRVARHFSDFQQVFAFFSFMFLHGGFWHLLGNMWFLHIFGDNVEDRLGHLRYLFFYLLCGLASGVSHMLLNRYSPVPTIGASGAVAGVMGAYFICYPRAKILTLIPIFFIPYFIEVSAFFFLGLWLVMQLFNAAGSLGRAGGIAWWAHVGGFVFGMLLLKVLSALPQTGVSGRMRRLTAVQSTPRLQVIRPADAGDDPDLYGVIEITAREADSGARKLVSITGGGRKRLVRVSIPPGVQDGALLRLRGLGRAAAGGRQGDLLLKVVVG